VLVDAVTYVASVASLALIRAPEPHPQPAAERASLRRLAREVAEGLRLTWEHPARRAIAGARAINALGGSLLETALVIFILRDLQLSPALMGLSFGVGGVASFVGAVMAERVTARLGLARALRWSAWVSRGLGLLIPLAGGPAWLAFALLTIPQLGDAAWTIYDISATSALQLVTPSSALGRVVASGNVLRSVGALLGLGLGATVGAALGPRGSLALAMVGMLLGPLLLSLTPIRDRKLAPGAVATARRDAGR
jgi:MFS family permease